MRSPAPILARLASAGQILRDVVFPRTCAACADLLVEPNVELCPGCATELSLHVGGDWCRVCGADIGPHLLREGRCADCAAKRPVLARFARVGRYDGPLRDAILRFKAEPGLDRMLGRLLADLVRSEMAGHTLSALVPIPSPFIRRWRRRYQPTELLAREVSRRLAVAWQPLLEMARRVRPQTGLSGPQRERNVRGAFRCVPGRSAAGRTLCLIDDVSTTGATLREAARTLLEVGAKEVVAAVVARAS